MNLNPRQFFRMAKWARNPPSEKRVKLVLAVIALALVLFGIEKLVGTPDWMQIDRLRPGAVMR